MRTASSWAAAGPRCSQQVGPHLRAVLSQCPLVLCGDIIIHSPTQRSGRLVLATVFSICNVTPCCSCMCLRRTGAAANAGINAEALARPQQHAPVGGLACCSVQLLRSHATGQHHLTCDLLVVLLHGAHISSVSWQPIQRQTKGEQTVTSPPGPSGSRLSCATSCSTRTAARSHRLALYPSAIPGPLQAKRLDGG